MLTEVNGLPVVEVDMGTIVVEEVFLYACWKGFEHVKDVKWFDVPVLGAMGGRPPLLGPRSA